MFFNCIEAAARCLLVVLFLPFSALDKVLNFRQAVGQASEAVTSTGFAAALIFLGMCFEIVASACIVTGLADRLAALTLAGYCVLTALLWKQFWKKADFKLRGTSLGRETFWDFLKNLALAGGFCMLALGPNAASVRDFLKSPLSSSRPYAMPEAGL